MRAVCCSPTSTKINVGDEVIADIGFCLDLRQKAQCLVASHNSNDLPSLAGAVVVVGIHSALVVKRSRVSSTIRSHHEGVERFELRGYTHSSVDKAGCKA